jgi:hypothetical protein
VIDLIGIGHIGDIAIEMARARRQLDGWSRLIADEMDDVEALGELDEIAIVGVIA